MGITRCLFAPAGGVEESGAGWNRIWIALAGSPGPRGPGWVRVARGAVETGGVVSVHP